MVIGALVGEGTRALLRAGIESARLDAEVLLSHLLKKDRVFLAVHREDEVDDHLCESYRQIINRRKAHEPVAYITGEREFMSLSFTVRPGVLIPRPDTETLVEFVIGALQKTEKPRILDLCTGSGAIAVSLAYYVKESEITACDLSPVCLKTAAENAEKNGVQERVSFAKKDVLKPLSFSEIFDCVASNPPYIETKTMQELEPDVRDFEPHLALDGGQDGLLFYRAISKNAAALLKTGGLLAFEVGHNQANAVAELMQKTYENIDFAEDLSGIRRVVYGTKK